MSQKIVRLPEDVVNRIAAGEVVENPASLIKELIENSLDAKARRISIWIEGGGEALIQVEDDGCGMSREDCVRCFERHATSKIRSEEDLQRLVTMGFRGEALAAIAAVSRVELKSSDGQEGTLVQVDGGQMHPPVPCARNRGTTIAVRSLFFNVPARKKFLKSSVSQIVRVVETIAMAHPEVSFTLYSEKKRLVETFPAEHKKRIEHLVGPMAHVVDQEGVWGLLSPAEEAKLQRRGQYLFVNLRPVFSPLISKAVKMGYGTRIGEAVYPSFVLFLSLPPEEIDVNVHPQKKEIRFANERRVFRLVEQAVASCFAPAPSFLEPLVFSPPPFSFAEPITPFLPSSPLSFDFPVIEKPIAVVEGFLLLQGEAWLLVDLAAAHARVLYEALKEKKGELQTLMWPIEMQVDDELLAEELQEMGIECRWIGKRMLAIDALPSLLNSTDFSDFVLSWKEGKRIDVAACRYARGTKRQFQLDEAVHLWKQLQQCREKKYDPTGKLIWDQIDKNRLKRMLE